MTLEDDILDTMADGMMPITSVRSLLLHVGYDMSMPDLKNIILKMIVEGMVMIVYPEDMTLEDYANIGVDDEMELRCWFLEMTEQGRRKWKIVAQLP